MSFSVENFLTSPTLAAFHSLKKDQLCQIARHLNVSNINAHVKKEEIKELLLPLITFVEEDPALENADNISTNSNSSEYRLEELKLRLQLERDLEFKKLELNSERESKREERDFQLQMKKLELEHANNNTNVNSGAQNFLDLPKNVPPFKEDQVDQYFVNFEKIATTLNWPKE